MADPELPPGAVGAAPESNPACTAPTEAVGSVAARESPEAPVGPGTAGPAVGVLPRKYETSTLVLTSAIGAALFVVILLGGNTLHLVPTETVDIEVTLATMVSFLWVGFWNQSSIRRLFATYLDWGSWEGMASHGYDTGWEGARVLAVVASSITVISLATVAFLADSPKFYESGGISTVFSPAFIGAFLILGAGVSSAWSLGLYSAAASPHSVSPDVKVAARLRARASHFAYWCLLASVYGFFIGLLWAMSEFTLWIPILTLLVYLGACISQLAFVR